MQISNIKYQNLKLKRGSFCVLILFLIFALCALIFSPTVSAQAQVFTAIPPRLEIQVKPGQFVQKTIQFRNEGDTTAYLQVIPKDFVVKGIDGRPDFVTQVVSGRWAASSWIRAVPSTLAVAPKSTADITLSINVPLDALPGGHYAGVLYESKGSTPRVSGGGTGSAVQQIVGTLAYITVAGPVSEKAFVRDFTAPGFSEFGPIPFTTQLLNESDIHIAPKGQITIFDIFGRTVKVLPLEERNIFPGTSVVYKNNWDVKYPVGRYRANLVAAYGTGGHVLTATIYFIVFPVRVALAVILAILIVVLAVTYLRRRKKEKDNKDEKEITPQTTVETPAVK